MKTLKQLMYLYLAVLALSSCDSKEDVEEIVPLKNFAVEITGTTPDSPASICLDEWVVVNYNYKSDEDDVLLFIRPMSAGELTPGYAAEPSSLLPIGNGSGITKFKITSGDDITIDQLRIEMYNADQSELLLEKFVDVEFNVVLNSVEIKNYSGEEKHLNNGEWIDFDFDYKITNPSGARIFIRPFTDGDRSPNYGASGSPIFNGEGNSDAGFTINAGEITHIDQLRIQVFNHDQSELLLEKFVDADITYKGTTVKITDLVPNTNELDFGDKVEITFEYDVVELEGARIFIRPFTDGELSPNYSASPSPIFTNDGSHTVEFSISSGSDDIHVDQLRILVVNPSQTKTILEKFVDVDYTFK